MRGKNEMVGVWSYSIQMEQPKSFIRVNVSNENLRDRILLSGSIFTNYNAKWDYYIKYELCLQLPISRAFMAYRETL